MGLLAPRETYAPSSPHLGVDSERVEQVHGQRCDGARGRAVGPGQRDAHRTVTVDGLHQHAHGQREALGVGGVGVTQQGDLVVGHRQALVAQALLQKPDTNKKQEIFTNSNHNNQDDKKILTGHDNNKPLYLNHYFIYFFWTVGK